MTALAAPSASPGRTGRTGRVAIVLDIGERILLAGLYMLLVRRLWPSLAETPINALLIAAETIVIGFVLCRRQTSSITKSPADWLLALCGTLPPLFFRAGGLQLALAAPAAILMATGILIQVWAKFSLRRSFGIAAANRGVKVGGPYGLIRHPMYVGYAITWIGFLSVNGLWTNLALASFAATMQILRIVVEERLLRNDPEYGAYMARVRYRILPGVF
jgi:protein-S-isoprenylcysteine O-methyltransferase Ste14